MSKKMWIIFVVAMSVVLAISGCTRSASNAPVPTATKGTVFPSPLPNDSVKNAQSGTQTAMALAKVPTLGAGTPSATLAQVQPTATTAPATQAVAAANTATPVPPTATNIVVPTATPGRPATYTLQQGEFPFCIARRFNVDAGTLLALNGLNVNSRPQVGYVLKIPQTGPWTNGARALIAHPATYTVQAGDTIYKIACAYGDVDPNAIILANGLKSPYTLSAGQTLQIP
jgi:LysM repeat protein